jgi:hypothetical protein
MQHTYNHLFNLEKWTKDFSYTIFPLKKINVEKKFKIMRKLLFNFPSYSHPEIWKFQGLIYIYIYKESSLSIDHIYIHPHHDQAA